MRFGKAMNQNKYLQIIDEMTIPASKTLYWANIVKSEFQEIYDQYDKSIQVFFDEIMPAAKKLVDSIQKLRQFEQTEKQEIFTHTLAGPIITIRDTTKIILLQHSEQEEGQSEKVNEYIRYLKKIRSAAEFLWSLDRDAVLQIHLEHLNNE